MLDHAGGREGGRVGGRDEPECPDVSIPVPKKMMYSVTEA